MVDLICGNRHKIVEEVVCPDCGQPLTWAGGSSEKENVACCWHCWEGKGRNFIIRDVVKFLNFKKCPKCGVSQFFFIKKS